MKYRSRPQVTEYFDAAFFDGSVESAARVIKELNLNPDTDFEIDEYGPPDNPAIVFSVTDLWGDLVDVDPNSYIIQENEGEHRIVDSLWFKEHYEEDV
jgi:hypothetical protein